MTGDRDTKDPNVDTFDHIGEREHQAPPAIEPITARALRIGPPANDHGEIFAAGCIKPTSGIPVMIGFADVAADGTVTIRLAPGVAVPAGSHVETGLGFRVIRERWDGDDRVVDELEAITVWIEFKTAAQP